MLGNVLLYKSYAKTCNFYESQDFLPFFLVTTKSEGAWAAFTTARTSSTAMYSHFPFKLRDLARTYRDPVSEPSSAG